LSSIIRLLAVRKDAGFENPFYLMEATEHSLTLTPLSRRWLTLWMLFMMAFMAPFAIILLFAIVFVVQSYPATRPLEWDVVSPSLILFGVLSYGWSRRLAWRFSKTNEKRLDPKIIRMKHGIFSTNMTVDTEEGAMLLVVQGRRGTIARALELSNRP